MNQALQRLKARLNASFLFLGKLISAGLGIIFYPIGNLYRLSVAFLSISIIAFIAIPVLSIMAASFLHSLIPSMGWLGASVGGILTASALIGLTSALIPTAFLISGLFTLIKSPIEGAKIGWNEGFVAMLRSVFQGRSQVTANAPRGAGRFAIGVPGLGEGIDFQQILEQLGERAANAARQPLTEMQFNALQLPHAEVRALKSGQLPPLTEEELSMLQATGDIQIKAMVERYRNLQRLETENCSIVLERPEREDTILLVKQYQQDGQWLPVPGVVNVFDKSSLKMYFVGNETTRGNGIHPLNRDNILTPSNYADAEGTSYPTRYVMHHYYVDSGCGISQEVNQLTAKLRNCLRPRQRLEAEPGMPFSGLGFSAS
ncbi:hypothetical protein [Legionella nagasakiensis]|uniref:hypothetical protein n=1 Tax=Legionella nagasakiensis TaxID=535290 RepID=UPI001055A15A|nr:hypothetical protein [Legionella nagasakiensis]